MNTKYYKTPIDWFAMACAFLNPAPTSKTSEKIDREEAAAIEQFEREHPAPKHVIQTEDVT